MTASEDVSEIAGMLRLGVQDVVLKPLDDIPRLREVLLECLYPSMFASKVKKMNNYSMAGTVLFVIRKKQSSFSGSYNPYQTSAGRDAGQLSPTDTDGETRTGV